MVGVPSISLGFEKEFPHLTSRGVMIKWNVGGCEVFRAFFCERDGTGTICAPQEQYEFYDEPHRLEAKLI